MTDLTSHTLTEMQTGLSKGQFSSRELVQAALKRIESSDAKTHAFLHLAAEKALADADEADKQRTTDRGRQKPLLGVPVAIKDVLTVEGLPCTCGSKILEGYVPPTAGGGLTQMTLRADEPHPSLSTDELLKNAPEAEDDQFKIPPVFE